MLTGLNWNLKWNIFFKALFSKVPHFKNSFTCAPSVFSSFFCIWLDHPNFVEQNQIFSSNFQKSLWKCFLSISICIIRIIITLKGKLNLKSAKTYTESENFFVFGCFLNFFVFSLLPKLSHHVIYINIHYICTRRIVPKSRYIGM